MAEVIFVGQQRRWNFSSSDQPAANDRHEGRVSRNGRERNCVLCMVRSKNFEREISDTLIPDTLQLGKALDLTDIEPYRQARVDGSAPTGPRA